MQLILVPGSYWRSDRTVVRDSAIDAAVNNGCNNNIMSGVERKVCRSFSRISRSPVRQTTAGSSVTYMHSSLLGVVAFSRLKHALVR